MLLDQPQDEDFINIYYVWLNITTQNFMRIFFAGRRRRRSRIEGKLTKVLKIIKRDLMKIYNHNIKKSQRVIASIAVQCRQPLKIEDKTKVFEEFLRWWNIGCNFPCSCNYDVTRGEVSLSGIENWNRHSLTWGFIARRFLNISELLGWLNINISNSTIVYFPSHFLIALP